ncbi:MAG: hypothetical protein ACP5D2_01000, partial [Candidatus Nanoarchaeia archaeon]
GLRQADRRGFGWMKFSSVSGIFSLIFIIAAICLFIASIFFKIDLILISVILGFAGGVTFIFYLIGFIKLGYCVDSGLMKFSSISLFILILINFIISFILILGSYFLVNLIMDSFQSDFTTTTGMVISSGDALIGLGIVLLVVVAIVGLFNLLVQYLFFISLIKSRQKIAFSGVTGILGIVFVSGWIIGSVVLPILQQEIVSVIFIIFLGLVGLLDLLFGSLTLLYASYRYE